MLALCIGNLAGPEALAQSPQGRLMGIDINPKASADKLSPDLHELLGGAAAAARGRQERVRVIIQTGDMPTVALDSLLQGNGGRLIQRFQNFNARVVELPVR